MAIWISLSARDFRKAALSRRRFQTETVYNRGTMTLINRVKTTALLAAALFSLVCTLSSQAQTTPGQSAPPKYPNYPSETPDELEAGHGKL